METVPLFPEFRKFSLADAVWYDEFYKPHPDYADFTFNNLLVWQDQYADLEVTRIDQILVFKCTSLYMDNQLMINFVGDGDYDVALEKIFTYLHDHHLQEIVLGVPEYIVKRLKHPDTYECIEDRDNAEYVMDVALLASLEGPTMKRMRQLVNGYERDNHPLEIKELDMHDTSNRDYLRSRLLGWERAFATNETSEQERDVILRTLDLAGELNYGNVSLYVGDTLVGFALYREIPSDKHDTVVVNHLKSSYGVMHTSYYLTHRLAQVLRDKGYSYMNYEQDLGIEGLRVFKERLKPVNLLNKYNVSPR